MTDSRRRRGWQVVVGRRLLRSVMVGIVLVLAAVPGLAGAAPLSQATKTFTFCLQSPAVGQISWEQRWTAAPSITLNVRRLPASAGLLIFVDEETSREAYDFTAFTTDAAGAATVRTRAFYYPGPTRVARLLLEDDLANVVATALPCTPEPAVLPATGAGGVGRRDQSTSLGVVLALVLTASVTLSASALWRVWRSHR